MSNSPIQPTGPLNIETRQTDTVANASVGKFQDRVVANRDKAIIKYLSIISGSFALGQSLARICRSVGQRIYAFVKQHFGGTSKATSVMQPQIEMSPVRPSQQYTLIDVPGNGNCGIYAVLVGMGVLDSSEFRKPTHPDQGSHPLANAVQEQKVGELRKKSAEIAHKALGSRYSLEELKNMNEKKLSNKEKKIKNLLEMGSSVSEDNMKFVTEAIQKPIMVHVFQGNFCSKTLFEVGKDGQYWDNVYGNEVYPEIKASEDTIHLYLSNGHYQLMSPIKAP